MVHKKFLNNIPSLSSLLLAGLALGSSCNKSKPEVSANVIPLGMVGPLADEQNLEGKNSNALVKAREELWMQVMSFKGLEYLEEAPHDFSHVWKAVGTDEITAELDLYCRKFIEAGYSKQVKACLEPITKIVFPKSKELLKAIVGDKSVLHRKSKCASALRDIVNCQKDFHDLYLKLKNKVVLSGTLLGDDLLSFKDSASALESQLKNLYRKKHYSPNKDFFVKSGEHLINACTKNDEVKQCLSNPVGSAYIEFIDRECSGFVNRGEAITESHITVAKNTMPDITALTSDSSALCSLTFGQFLFAFLRGNKDGDLFTIDKPKDEKNKENTASYKVEIRNDSLKKLFDVLKNPDTKLCYQHLGTHLSGIPKNYKDNSGFTPGSQPVHADNAIIGSVYVGSIFDILDAHTTGGNEGNLGKDNANELLKAILELATVAGGYLQQEDIGPTINKLLDITTSSFQDSFVLKLLKEVVDLSDNKKNNKELRKFCLNSLENKKITDIKNLFEGVCNKYLTVIQKSKSGCEYRETDVLIQVKDQLVLFKTCLANIKSKDFILYSTIEEDPDVLKYGKLHVESFIQDAVTNLKMLSMLSKADFTGFLTGEVSSQDFKNFISVPSSIMSRIENIKNAYIEAKKNQPINVGR